MIINITYINYSIMRLNVFHSPGAVCHSYKIIRSLLCICSNFTWKLCMCDSFTLNNLHFSFCSSLYGVELFNLTSLICYIYIQLIGKLYVVYLDTYNSIVIKLAGDLVSRLDCRIAKFIWQWHCALHHSKQARLLLWYW